MKVADLFVAINLQGAKEVASGLGGVRQGLIGISAELSIFRDGFSAVRSIFQGFAGQGMEYANSLQMFENRTGQSTETLEKFRFALIRSGVDAEEAQSSLEGMHKAMVDMTINRKPPSGLSAVQELVGFDPTRGLDIPYVTATLMKYVAEARKRGANPEIIQSIVGSFGVTPNAIGVFGNDTFSKAFGNTPSSALYSKGQKNALESMFVELKTVTNKFEHGFGKVSAQFGPSLVKDFSVAADSALKLLSALAGINQELKLTAILGDAIKGWAGLLSGAALILDPKTRGAASKDLMLGLSGALESVMPDISAASRSQMATTQQRLDKQNGINQTNNISVHGIAGKEELAQEIASAAAKGLNNAFRSGQPQGF